MDKETTALLGQILTALVLERAAKLMGSWEIRERERTGEDVVEMPPAERFVDDACDEILAHRDRVMSRLLGVH